MGGITGRDWVRIVASGLLAEGVIIAIFVAVAFAGGRAAAMYSALAASFAVCFASGFWVAQRARGSHLIQGLLVGLVATLVYVALTRARPEPWVYVVAHGLKVFGGAGGGIASGCRAGSFSRAGGAAQKSG